MNKYFRIDDGMCTPCTSIKFYHHLIIIIMLIAQLVGILNYMRVMSIKHNLICEL